MLPRLVTVFDQKLPCAQILSPKAVCVQVWRELFSPLHALSFGIGGDTTCNVLWRLQNGELENIRPKVSLRECPFLHFHGKEIELLGLMNIPTKTVEVAVRKNREQKHFFHSFTAQTNEA